MTTYISVCEEENGECIEIPVEDDGTLYLSTLMAQFPGACGLKFRNPDSKSLRGVKLIEERLICPDEGWVHEFFCTFPKESKRKSSDILESSSHKSKRLDLFTKCTDLIVLDLPWKTTEQEMKDYFNAYGNVIMAQLKKDSKTGQSRGYGFIRFEDIEVQKNVLNRRHVIDGRPVDVRIPKSKEPNNPYLGGKVFVGRITEEFTEQDLRDYFGKYGEVSYVFIPKKPFRAFSFVTFHDPEVAMEVCDQDHIIKGVSVCVSSAKERKEPPKSQSDGSYAGGGGGMYGGGYGNSGGYGNGGGGYGGNSGNQGGGYRKDKWGGHNNGGGGGGGGNWNGGGWNGGSGKSGGSGGAGAGAGVFDHKTVDYNAIAAPIVAAISQQLSMAAAPHHRTNY